MSIKFLNRLVGSLCVKNVYKKIEPLCKVKRLNRSNNQQLKNKFGGASLRTILIVTFVLPICSVVVLVWYW